MTTKSGGAITIPSMDPAVLFNLSPEQIEAAIDTIARHAHDDADQALLLDMCGLTSGTNTPGGNR